MRVSQSKGSPEQEYRHYVVCKGAYPKVGQPRVCDRRSSYGLEVGTIVDQVIGRLSRLSERMELLGTIDDDAPPQPTPEMVEISDNIEKLTALNMPETKEVVDRLKTAWSVLQAEQYVERKDYRDLVESTRKLIGRPGFWDSPSPEELRIVFPALVEDVVCDEGAIEVKTYLDNLGGGAVLS